MNHLVATTVAEETFDFTAFVSHDAARVGGGVGAEAARQQLTMGSIDNNSVTALEIAGNSGDAGRQETLAGGQGARGADIEGPVPRPA